MQVEDIAFTEFKSNVKGKEEGIVLLGAGGDPQEWINGVTDILNKEDIAKGTPEELWGKANKLTTTGGRTDIALTFNHNNGLKFNMGKMAMWRLRFGECSWISDYLDNYAKHFKRNPDGTPCE